MNKEILFFSAPWCGPCSQIKIQLTEEFIKENNIRNIDISEDMETAIKYEVMNVPTFIKLIEGQEVSRKIGSINAEGIKNL